MTEKSLVFASANQNKVKEVAHKLGGKIPILGLADIGCTDDIPETGSTLEENAIQKARFIWLKYHMDCFADDTGLEVTALNNEPGVYSARYAGDQRSASDNIDLVLKKLAGEKDRSARFRTVICLILDGKEFLFEGIASGDIIQERKGEEGFGYDPIFIPSGELRTFAEMTINEKNIMSHRAKAIQLLSSFLETKVANANS